MAAPIGEFLSATARRLEEGSWFWGVLPPRFLPEKSIGYVPKLSGHSNGSLTQVESSQHQDSAKARPTDWRARWYGLRPDAAAMQTFSTSRLIVGGVCFVGHLMPI